MPPELILYLQMWRLRWSTINVTVNPIPAAPAASNNSPICAFQTLSLTASTVAGATYNWTGPNTFTSNVQNPTIPSASMTAAGIYTVTVTVLGCTSPVGTTSVTINPAPRTNRFGHLTNMYRWQHQFNCKYNCRCHL